MAGRRKRRRARGPRRGELRHEVARPETTEIAQERDARCRAAASDGHARGGTRLRRAPSGCRRDPCHACVSIQTRPDASSLPFHAQLRRDGSFVRAFSASCVEAPRRQADEPSASAETAWTAVFDRSFCGLFGRGDGTTHVRRAHCSSSSHRDTSDESKRRTKRRGAWDVAGSAEQVVRGAGGDRGPQAWTKGRKERWKQHLQVLGKQQHENTHVHVWRLTSAWWIECQGRRSCKHPAATRWTRRTARGTSAP